MRAGFIAGAPAALAAAPLDARQGLRGPAGSG
jgi:hypothetical protein